MLGFLRHPNLQLPPLLKIVPLESDGEPAVVVAALGDIARARGMMQLARNTGLTREELYKALSPEGNPSFATVMKVCKALGLKMHTEPV